MVPPVASEVDDLNKELERNNFIILSKPNASSGGARVARIERSAGRID